MDESSIIKTVGERLRQVRIEKGLSQQWLALEADIPKNQVGRIERGEINTTIGTLYKLSEALNIPISNLFEQPSK